MMISNSLVMNMVLGAASSKIEVHILSMVAVVPMDNRCLPSNRLKVRSKMNQPRNKNINKVMTVRSQASKSTHIWVVALIAKDNAMKNLIAPPKEWSIVYSLYSRASLIAKRKTIKAQQMVAQNRLIIVVMFVVRFNGFIFLETNPATEDVEGPYSNKDD